MKPLLLLFLLGALKVMAQDTLPASKEPLHKNVFENKYVRVLDLHIAPGDTTKFHKHEKPIASVSLHPTRTGVQTIVDDKGPRVPSLDRRITFEGFYQNPRVHRVWNRDTTVFHWRDIEVLSNGGRLLDSAISLEGFTQVFDAPPVRAYRLVLKADQKVAVKRTAPLLFVGMTDGGKTAANKKMFSNQGDFLFVQPSEKISLTNKGDKEYAFAVLEFK